MQGWAAAGRAGMATTAEAADMATRAAGTGALTRCGGMGAAGVIRRADDSNSSDSNPSDWNTAWAALEVRLASVRETCPPSTSAGTDGPRAARVREMNSSTSLWRQVW